KRMHIGIGTDGDVAALLHLHQFHILQTVSNNSVGSDVGVPARGLHGEAYRGHIFWDELFVFPFLSLRFPQLARALLLYRYRRLDQARHNAAEAGYEGAMFPWQSASNGREETQTMHLNPVSGRWLPDASHLQRHVNAAVSLNVWQYYQATEDLEFLRFQGAEMILEVARFWASIASYNHGLDRYEITGVMGPDEYHEGYPDRDRPGLDNNAYTNLMAVWSICRAFDVLDVLPPDVVLELRERLMIGPDDLALWTDVSRKMRVCFHDGVISQFEGYENLVELDWDQYRSTYGDIHRLDRILEAEGDSPNRYKLAKQPDVMMLFYVLSADELTDLLVRLGYDYDSELIARSIEYYAPRSAHGSTLSRVVQAWILARQDRAQSWKIFLDALRSDFDDVQGGTTPEGIHLGAMGGTVDLLQRCYSGLETREDALRLDPVIPRELGRLAFDVHYRGLLVALELTPELARVRIDMTEGAPITISCRGRRYRLQPGNMLEIDLT
ncbi:MAG: glycosyl hydrolase family 65 protein, partial [Aquihabitans sp.]